jgi:hypothetical protein
MTRLPSEFTSIDVRNIGSVLMGGNSYFDAIARIAQRDYMPTDQDILRARVKTTGITYVQAFSSS